MPKLLWDQDGQKLFETGVSNGVLYVKNGTSYGNGVAWNGLTAVTESPSGAEANPLYADNIKYLNLISAEEFGATIEAYTYPDEFGVCDGSAELSPGVIIGQQGRKTFGLSYKTLLGNDAEGTSYGYKLHIIYGALAAPSEKAYATVNDSPEAITFSWELTTTPVNVTGLKPTASITIDSTKVPSAKLTALENVLYGTESSAPRLPMPDEVASIFANPAPTALALSTSVPAADATGVAVAANIVLTFNNAIVNESVMLMTNAGVVVPFTKSWDSAKKVMTIDPTTNLSASTTYLLYIGGVSDIYSQSLATVVRKFTTA
ncbi:hypothetical protein SDC9_88743 [bioreactor metagenome]|uniref:SbsA Ig-like domain-containing protein n=1 Tax=bioreactor metagenome TaxID=1076179 RepID=A0A644ZQB8_9ZZZZ